MAIVSVAIIVNFHLKTEPSAVGTYAFRSKSKAGIACLSRDFINLVAGYGFVPRWLETNGLLMYIRVYS